MRQAIPCHVETPSVGPTASTPSATACLCDRCEAVCCRLTAVLMPDDQVPEWLVAHSPDGPDAMRREDDGWCAAIDRDTMRCTIYQQRPQVCRDFAMGGDYCLSERANWHRGTGTRTDPCKA